MSPRRAHALPHAPANPPDERSSSLLRGIAGFEALKGVVAAGVAIGLLSLVHRDLRHLATALIGHVGLDPGQHYPAAILSGIDRWQSADHRPLLLAMAGYVLLRFTEAYGLWRARAWGEMLGAASGALYVPFELRHLIHRPSVASAVVLGTNVAVVAFLIQRLRRRGRARPDAPTLAE